MLLNECDAVAEKLAAIQRKIQGLELAEQAHGYQDTIGKCMVLFRTALINNFGKKQERQELLDTQGNTERVTKTLQQNGFRDCEDFMDHVEKTVSVGYIPEHKISMIVSQLWI